MRSFIAFAAGAVFAVVLLVRCGVPGARRGGSGNPGGPGGSNNSNMMTNASADDFNADGTRLKVSYYKGADGSESSFGLYDSSLKVACSWWPATDGTTRCMPIDANTYFYADASCQMPILFWTHGCTPPKYIYTATQQGGACGTTYAYAIHPIGSMISSPAQIYELIGGSCTESSASGGDDDVWTLGSAIPPSSFVEGTAENG